MSVRHAPAVVFWSLAVAVALGVGVLTAVLLYLQVIPLWDFFRPPIESADYEGVGEWRMAWFSLAIGGIAALGLLTIARRSRSR